MGFIEGFFTPREPINRVMGMLKKIWAFFVD
jgi:hypothetical protein